jgi:putative transposase
LSPVARRGTRFEALEPVPWAVHEQFGGLAEGIASGVKRRHDRDSQSLSEDFQSEIRLLGIESLPDFVGEPEGNGSAERLFRTLKEQLLRVRDLPAL